MLPWVLASSTIDLLCVILMLWMWLTFRRRCVLLAMWLLLSASCISVCLISLLTRVPFRYLGNTVFLQNVSLSVVTIGL